MTFEHIVRFERGYDCIRFQCVNDSPTCKPGEGGSHGRHGLTIRFVIKGREGAVQFCLGTGWTPQHAKPNDIGYREVANWGSSVYPSDLGYHARSKQYDSQEPISDKCEFCDGEPCFYDGSTLNATDAMYALVNGGGDALWLFLESYYRTVFSGANYPATAEYHKPLRPQPAREGKEER